MDEDESVLEVQRLSLRWLVRLAVLALLSVEGPMHGYGIYKRLLEVFSRARLISPSLVYMVVSELIREGLLEEAGFEPNAPSGGRKILRITERGMNYLAEQGGLAWRMLGELVKLLSEGELKARVEIGDYGGVVDAAAEVKRLAEDLAKVASKYLGEH